jgi:hypothetical protein
MKNYLATFLNPLTKATVTKTYNNISPDTLQRYITLYTSLSGFQFVSSAEI